MWRRRRIVGALRLLQDDLAIGVSNAGQLTGVVLRFTDAAAWRPILLHALFLRVLWRLLACLVEGRLRAQRFDFAFDQPARVSSLGKLFRGAVLFNLQHSAFCVNTPYMLGPVRHDEAASRSFLADAQVHAVLPLRGEDTPTGCLRSVLLPAQPRWPALEQCAKVVRLTAFMVLRCPASENTPVRAIRDSLRRHTAIARLNGSRVPLFKRADELGFADSAAFLHRFKACTGVSPGRVWRPLPEPGSAPRSPGDPLPAHLVLAFVPSRASRPKAHARTRPYAHASIRRDAQAPMTTIPWPSSQGCCCALPTLPTSGANSSRRSPSIPVAPS